MASTNLLGALLSKSQGLAAMALDKTVPNSQKIKGRLSHCGSLQGHHVALAISDLHVHQREFSLE